MSNRETSNALLVGQISGLELLKKRHAEKRERVSGQCDTLINMSTVDELIKEIDEELKGGVK